MTRLLEFDLSAYCDGLKELVPGVWGPSQENKKRIVHFPEELYQVNARLEETSFWFAHRNNCITQTIKNFPPHGPIFDVGGGNGIVTQAVRKIGYDAILVEPGAEAVAAAQKRKLLPIIQADFLDLNFKDASLPSVGLFDVIEHIEDDENFLMKIHGLLTSRGVIYLTVPAGPKLWSEEDVKAKHFRRYTLGSLQKLLRTCGFDVEYATYFFSYLILPVFFVRSLPHLLGMKRGADRYKKDFSVRYESITKRLDAREMTKIVGKGFIPQGTSLLAVARK